MRIEFNKVTWYSRMLSIIFLFGIFPVLVFYIGKEYQKTMDVLTGANSLTIDLQTSGQIKTSGFTREEYAVIKKITGAWKDTSSKSRVLVIKSMNRYFNWEGGAPIDSGSWTMLTKAVLQSTESLDNTKLYIEFISAGNKQVGSDQNGGGNIVKQTLRPGSDLYSVQRIDDQTLELFNISSGKVETFQKVKEEKMYLGQ